MKQYIYIATPKSNTLEVFDINKKNEISLKQKINTNGQAQPIFFFKKKKILYVGVRPNNKLITYKIKKDGTLSFLSSLSIPCSLNNIDLDKKKNIILCCSFHMGCIISISINKDGIPEKIIQKIPYIPGCHAVKIDNVNKKIFSTSLKTNSIYVYKLKKNKNLIKKKIISCKKNSLGPRHIALHPDKKYMYIINENSGNIDIWKIKKKIQCIKQINLIPVGYNKKPWFADIHISPSCKYLYVTDRASNTIILLQIKKNGSSLKILNYFKTTKQPRSFAINKEGNLLAIAGEKSNNFYLYSICQKTGILYYLQKNKTGKNPIWIIFN